MEAFKKIIVGFTLVISVLLAPPIFNRLFAMMYLFDGERVALWIVVVLLLCGGSYVRFGRRHSLRVSFVLFNIMVLISLELAARAGVKLVFPEKEASLAHRGNMSYDDLRIYTGHPFLQFVGVPSGQRVGDRALGDLTAFNNFGFVGEDFTYAKPDDVIRIGALGGSTTATGYPAHMNAYLNAQFEAKFGAFEVMNFGHGFYTTAHSLANFVLNVVDFDPDYVVIHHGWNDINARADGADFRSDYLHHLKAFTPPRFVPDRYALRVSVIYRAVKFLFGPPEWAFVEHAAQVNRKLPQRPLSDRELATFRRNIETIVDLATLRQIKVILTTMPYTTDENIRQSDDHHYVDQFNQVLRAIASEYERLIFVDLDEAFTGQNDLFRDLGHLVEDGKRLKAQLIGDAIARDLRFSQPPAVDDP